MINNPFLATRRSFLKALGITGVAVNLYPFQAAEAAGWPGFDPNMPYHGSQVHFPDFVKYKYDQLFKKIIVFMDTEIKETIPPQYRRHIDYLILNPKISASDPLAQRGLAGWRYLPNGKGELRIE